MAFLIGGANSAAATAFSVANSCRFDDGSSAYMHKTPGGAGNQRKFTFSTCFKLGNSTANLTLFATGADGSNRFWIMRHNESSNDSQIKIDAKTSDTQTIELRTNASFRDPTAWIHLVVAVDTEQGTSTNRVKTYINGTQITSFNQTTYPDEDHDTEVNKAAEHRVGRYNAGDYYFDGYLAETVFIDGTQYAASDFGEFDSDSPTIWKPKDVSGLTFGTNGFYLDYEASDNLGNDANGGTDLTESGIAATDQTTDTPSLNYMTLNSIAGGVGDTARIPTFSEGNTKFTAAGSNTFYQAISTFGVAVGQWYFEVKVASDQDLDKLRVGYWNIDKTVASGEIQDVSAANSHVFYMNKDGGEMRLNTTPTTADYGTFADDELMGVAIDMDAQTITILKANSVIVNAYDYSGGIAAGTVLTPAFMGYDDTAFQVNFGNPHEANSSDEADENGYGAFEFAPPSGYLAYNSANLGSDGS